MSAWLINVPPYGRQLLRERSMLFELSFWLKLLSLCSLLRLFARSGLYVRPYTDEQLTLLMLVFSKLVTSFLLFWYLTVSLAMWSGLPQSVCCDEV